jgi:putative ABC transport system substrate-binding protein
VDLRPDVIVATNTPTLQALQQHTQTIPIVFYRVTDPLANGFVRSLAHPGGNVTGFTNQEFSVSGKWLELLRDIAPNVNRLMIVLDPENPTWRGYFRTIEAVAPTMGVQVIPAPVISSAGIERAIEDLAREPNGGCVVLPGPVTNSNILLIVGLVARHHLPAVYSSGVNAVRRGGLMSYGPDLLDQVRNAAGYVNRILRGEKPGELPVQQPTKYELVISLKTAKALGLEVPATLLARADEVIE